MYLAVLVVDQELPLFSLALLNIDLEKAVFIRASFLVLFDEADQQHVSVSVLVLVVYQFLDVPQVFLDLFATLELLLGFYEHIDLALPGRQNDQRDKRDTDHPGYRSSRLLEDYLDGDERVSGQAR